MKIEDVVFMLNKHIQIERDKLNISSKGQLILHKTILPHSTMKAYKEIEFCLWFVNNKHKFRLITLHHITRAINGQEEIIMDNLSKEFILKIFEWMKSEYYNKVVRGEYGNKDE